MKPDCELNTQVRIKFTVSEDFHSNSVDLTDPEAPQQIIDKVVSQTGRFDVLVNNAGIMKEATAEHTTLENWQATIAVNLTAPFLLIKYALSHLRKSAGSIVNIGSIEELSSNPQHPAYCASKAGLHGLTRAVAVNHGPEGIRCTGWIDTDINVEFIRSQTDSKAFRQALGGIHPVRNTGSPADVVALVAWLVSGEATFVTGQVITVDGGRMTKLSLP